MPQPTTARYTDAWHAAEDALERAWLDDWMRGRICPTTLENRPAQGPTATFARTLATAGSS
jgi:hypothetical protein